jgi:hypothetical protein
MALFLDVGCHAHDFNSSDNAQVAHHLLSPSLPLLILPPFHVAVDSLTRPHCSHRDLSCHLTLAHLFLSPRTVHRDFSASPLPPLATLLTRSRVCNTYRTEENPGLLASRTVDLPLREPTAPSQPTQLRNHPLITATLARTKVLYRSLDLQPGLP